MHCLLTVCTNSIKTFHSSQKLKISLTHQSSAMSNAPATQSYSWALPTSEKKKARENDHRKPIINPLMKKAPDFANGVQSPPHTRFPLASVDNNTSLRRRNISSTNTEVIKVILPPKLSLTVDGACMDLSVSFRFLTFTLTVCFTAGLRLTTPPPPPPPPLLHV